jgi:PTS system nitrogen regulatory IIA component
VPRIANLLGPENVVIDLRATSKKHALVEVSKLLAAPSGLTESAIFSTLIDRENLGSTGFGKGVAVPHARVPHVASTHMVFVRLARPVDFEASDDQPVDLICAIIGNYGSAAEPFEALVGACRVLRNPKTLTKLRNVRTAVDFHSILAEER